MNRRIKMNCGTSLVVQWLTFHLPMQRVRVPSLVRDLSSHMPHRQKTESRSNIVTNSIETFFKWSTSKKKKKPLKNNKGNQP